MKSKILVPLLLAGLAAACAENYVTVQVPFLEKRTVDFSKYQNVYYVDFIANVPNDIDMDADSENRRVFSEELPFVIEKKITVLNPPNWDMVRGVLRTYCPEVEIQYANNVFFRDVFRSHPQSLFITGKLNLEVKKLGVVKEMRDESGNKKNIYSAVQQWELEMKVWLIDGDAGAVLLEETFMEKLEPGPGTGAQFNYNGLLAKMSAKLGTKLQPRKSQQERTILYR